MESPNRLTVASTWKLETEGVERMGQFFKTLPHGSSGFCKYESTPHVFTVDNCDLSQSALGLARYLVDFVEGEGRNDLLENPKITRVAIPSGLEEDDVVNSRENAKLITDSPAPEAVKLPMAVRYWEGEGRSIDCFIKAPRELLAAVAHTTGAQVDLEQENKRIRVTSMQLWQADNAMEKLRNLERYLSLMLSPQVANILHTGTSKDFWLRILHYSSLNKAAARRILVDGPESKVLSHLNGFYVTVMESLDTESRDCRLPQNIVTPPRLMEQRKGRARIWENFKFPQLGNSSVLPAPGPNLKGDAVSKSSSSTKNNNVLVEAAIEGHSCLSPDKAFYVDKWVAEGVKAGAIGPTGSEPNSTLPPQPSAEVVVPPKPSVLKRRQAVLPGNGQGVVILPQPVKTKQEKPVPVQPVMTPALNATAPSFVPGTSKEPARQPADQTPVTAQRSRDKAWDKGRGANGRKAPTLIDTSITESDIPAPSVPQLQFAKTWTPLQPLLQPKPAYPVVNTPTSSPVERSNTPTPPVEPEGGQSSEDSNEGRLRKLKSLLKGTPPLPCVGLKIVEGEELQRVYHRTMGQRSPAQTSSVKGETKAEQKARKEAALLEAWGSVPVKAPSKPASPPEPSSWKKAQVAATEEIDTASIKDLFQSLEPVLDAVLHFPGTLTLEIQLGLSLTTSVNKMHTGRSLDVKTWNSLFRTRHGVSSLTTVFHPLLTSSGADIDYFFKLGDGTGSEHQPFFEPEPESRKILYEFHCQTKDNDMLIITVNETGTASFKRPDFILGATNIHFPSNIWDLRATVRGSQEYPATADGRILKSANYIVDHIYVPPNQSRVTLFTRVPEDSALRLTKILMRRTTRHKYIGKTLLDRANSPGSTDEQPIFLQITESQRLVPANNSTDKFAIRARALSPEEMIDNSRLWYGASIVSPAIEKVLEVNKSLAIGERVDSWCPEDLLGHESHLGSNTINESPVDSLTTAASDIGSSGIGNLFRLAKKVVEKIDVIGGANHAATVTTDKYPSPLASVPGGTFTASQGEGGKAKTSGMNKSVAPVPVDQGNYW